MIAKIIKIHTKNRGFIFGKCIENGGQDILIPSSECTSMITFHKLKKDSRVEGELQTTEEGLLKLLNYRIVGNKWVKNFYL